MHRASFALVCALFTSPCAVGGRHTPDAILEENFARHEPKFNAFLAKVLAEERLEMLNMRGAIHAGQSVSMVRSLEWMQAPS